ncbi:hypothetical protein E2562_035598 [Oryza meyeriana var. granulata]|uniref:MULE transposase domain-containing protein n=1 Tax=Oryza meyeriana var. granulata TaxID=110450 RepID=A0A6G1ESS3_9ORYZ|nr:hypothetical protein E2562_035598 [Oryza meyeriana var. granulata]
MATQGWVADRLTDWVKKNPNKGAKDDKQKLEEQYEIKLKYSKAWAGMKLALEQIYDACKGLEKVVYAAFSKVEHRECMRHLYANFIKKNQGVVFTEHLYLASRSYREDRFKWHMQHIYQTCKLAKPADEDDIDNHLTLNKSIALHVQITKYKKVSYFLPITKETQKIHMNNKKYEV